MRHQFCGLIRSHDAHGWASVVWQTPAWMWGARLGLRVKLRWPRWCDGALIERCGRDDTHPPHWHGELHDELCPGGGLAGVCPHGEQLLNECPDCPP